jgi:RNA polymerase sigma-70 factor (ECF subfamily)
MCYGFGPAALRASALAFCIFLCDLFVPRQSLLIDEVWPNLRCRCCRIVAEQFRAEIFAYIQSKVSDPATADDLTQETFVKVSRALAKGTTPEHFRGWLYQIARNTTIDFFTESRRFVPLEDSIVNREAGNTESYDPGDNEFRKQLFSYTLKVIETLPAEDREVLTLTEVDGLSREELAEELGISLTGSKNHKGHGSYSYRHDTHFDMLPRHLNRPQTRSSA